MLERPSFQPHFQVVLTDAETLYLLSEDKNIVLQGRPYVILAPSLQKNYTVDEIINNLKGQLSEIEVLYTLMLLEKKGYIAEADESVTREMAAFWSIQGIDKKTAVSRLQAIKVSVVTLGNVSPQPLVDALSSLNIQVGERGNFTMVLTDDYLQVGLAELNREKLQAQQSWMVVKPVGREMWIGPIFHPGHTGCWECLAQRLKGHRLTENFVSKVSGLLTPNSVGVIASGLQIGVNLALTELAKWIVLDTPDKIEGKVISLDLARMELKHHVLVRRPQCASCGDRAASQPEPIILKSQKKVFTTDGGHRVMTPEQTLQKYAVHISPITGIISTLVRSSEADNEIFNVYTAVYHKNYQDSDSLHSYLNANTAGGKGKTASQSQASAFSEAIERYSGTYTGDEIRVKGSYVGIGELAIHPNDCMLYSPTQYSERIKWNETNFIYDRVTEPFDLEQEIEWTPVWSLTNSGFKYLPTGYCYYNYPFPKNYRFCYADANGTAAGNTLEEAILQGFLELVERDSVALWWYNCIKRPSVDLDSFNEPYLQRIKDYYNKKGRSLWVLDITSDLGIPVFVAVSRRIQQEEERINFGFGAHLDAKIALLRAVTEMNQITLMELNNDANKDLYNWWRTATLSNQPYLVAEEKFVPKVYSDYPQLSSEDLCQDVFTCVEIVKKHGLETLVLDQTRPDIGMNVVKVFVPGLRHFWARFAAGRLYEIPVKLSWLPEQLTEEQLNPIAMFI